MEKYTNPINLKRGKIIGRGYVIGNLKSKSTGYLCGRFMGVNTALNFILNNDGQYGKLTKDDRSSRNHRGGYWTKFMTFEDSIDALRNKPEAFRDFETKDIKIIDHDTAGKGVEYDVTGDYLDIGAHLTGQPEAFGSMVDGKASNRFVNILVNGCVRCITTEEDIHQRARGIASVVDSLESQNIRVAVTIIYHTEECHLEIAVKQYDEALNIDEICVALSADMFRRIYFVWSEHSASHTSGYGREQSVLNDIKANGNETTILIDNGLNDWDDIGEVFNNLITTIENTDDIRGKLFYTDGYGKILIKEV